MRFLLRIKDETCPPIGRRGLKIFHAMKVLIFTTAYLPFVGGAELAIREITDRLPEVSFTLITARFSRKVPRHERIGNVEVYRVGLGVPFDKWLLPWLGFWKAERLEKKRHFDLIWSMMASQASVSATWFKKLHQDKKLVLTLQEGDEEAHLKRYVFGNEFLYRLFIRPWHTGVFKQADVITAISHYLAERARRNSSAKVEVIPNGVDVGRFKKQDAGFKKEELRRKLGIHEDERIMITVSRLVKKNGIGDLIEAMRFLPENVKLLILGSGSLEKSYNLKAKSYKLENKVIFLGYIPHEQLSHYLHIADIFCRPSLSEGMGSAFLEAMAAGVPVVATSVGGIPDFLFAPLPDSEEGRYLFANSRELANSWGERITGLFCKTGDPKDIAKKVQVLLLNEVLRKRIIANASTLVREKYGWDGIAEKMKAVFGSSDA